MKTLRHVVECPYGFTYISSVRGCYALVRDNLEWDLARIRCRSLHPDAHLVVVDNAKEQAAIAGFMAWRNSVGKCWHCIICKLCH